MSGPLSPDALLAHHPEGTGQTTLHFETGVLNPDVLDKVLAGSDDILWLGRSVLGQVGVEVEAKGELVDNNGSGVYVPVVMKASTPVGQALLEDLGGLMDTTEAGANVVWGGQGLPIGRFADMSRLAPMSADEVEESISDGMISFDKGESADDFQKPSYRLNDDGSVSVPLNPLEFVLNEEHFMGSPEARISLLHNGRAAVARDSDNFGRDADEPIPDFLLGGISVSAGPLFWRVISEVSDRLTQLKSAALFDANRLMGIGRHLPAYDRNRQVEIIKSPDRTNKKPEPTYGNTMIPVEFFHSKEVGQSAQGPVNWLRMTPAARRHRHINGVTALEALETADQGSREALLDTVRDPAIAAVVLSRRGIQTVKETGSSKMNTVNTIDKLHKAAKGVPSELEHLEPLIENLSAAGDRTATVVAEQVNLMSLSRLVHGGDARAILFERFRDDGSELVTLEEHSQLVDLSRQGVGIAWAQDGEYREFHPSGLWIKPGVAERIEQLEMTVAIFGAQREHVGKKHEEQIGKFLDGMIDIFDGADKLAVVHGNGGGIMRASDEAARKREILSFGVGIDVENLGQDQVNKAADGRLNMPASELLIRQHLLEAYSTVPVYTEGGIGTVVELDAALVVRKLLLSLPTPIIVVNPDGLYNDSLAQVRKLSRQGIAKKDSPRRWMENTLREVDDFENGAVAVLKEFHDDPVAFWRKAGIPQKHIAQAHEAHSKSLEKFGMRLPQFMQAAVKRYLAE